MLRPARPGPPDWGAQSTPRYCPRPRPRHKLHRAPRVAREGSGKARCGAGPGEREEGHRGSPEPCPAAAQSSGANPGHLAGLDPGSQPRSRSSERGGMGGARRRGAGPGPSRVARASGVTCGSRGRSWRGDWVLGGLLWKREPRRGILLEGASQNFALSKGLRWSEGAAPADAPRAVARLPVMLRWARTWRPPHAGLGLPRARRSTVPVSSGGQGSAGPGSVTGAPREAVLYFSPSGPTPRPTSSAWARPLPGCFHLPHPFPSGSGSPPILAPPARPGRLAYRLLDGDAVRPALVILHGLFGSQTNFSSVAKALAQQTGRRVSFWERRGPAGRGARWSGPGMRTKPCQLLFPHRWVPAEQGQVALSRDERRD